jgi:hypothetical protein
MTAFWASVPKAPVNEDCDAVNGKKDIRSSGQFDGVETPTPYFRAH